MKHLKGVFVLTNRGATDIILAMISQTVNSRERIKITQIGGYTIKIIGRILGKRKNETESEYSTMTLFCQTQKIHCSNQKIM